MDKNRKQSMSAQMACLLEHYLVPFGEILTLETADDFLYISDPDTYEIYYVSTPDISLISPEWSTYTGRKCYELMYQRTSPCPFCTSHLLSYDQYHIWIYHNESVNKDFVLKDKFITWHGKKARMEVVSVFSSQEQLKKLLLQSIDNQNVLLSCMSRMKNDMDVKSLIKDIIEKIGNYFDAEWGYLYCRGDMACLVHWSRHPDFFYPENPIPDSWMQSEWSELFTDNAKIIIRNTEELKEMCPDIYASMKSQGIRSSLSVPIYANEKLKGLFVINNFSKNIKECAFLTGLAAYISSLIQQENLWKSKYQLQYYDRLTGARNLEGYRREVQRILWENPGRKYALSYCDIKNFKYINDVFGFNVGNELLCYWAELSSRRCREGEVFCRVSDDNFSFFYWYEDIGQLEERFRGVVEALASFEPLASKNYTVELACGKYLLEQNDPISLNEMLNRANIAKKTVKNLPGSRYATFDKEIRERVAQEVMMEAEMHKGIENEEFQLWLQPKVDIQSAGKTSFSAEALVRWYRDGKLYAMPGDFIPLFERDGLIIELDYYMLEKACAVINRLKICFPSLKICIAVNMSRLTLLQRDCVERCRSIKDAYHIEDNEIELEFTENIVVNNLDRFKKLLSKLKAAGFRCAMDDFGTGHSSLNVLHGLSLDVLKLDRMFFMDADDLERSWVIVRNVIRMAKELHMQVVAEGIEEARQVELLKAYGCEFIQGYIFSKPLPEEAYMDWIRRTR